jgi:cytosine/uracil/thiamine/allantoin permease
MKKLVKAIIIGYSVLWLLDTLKEWFGDKEIKNLEDIKRILRENL